MQASADNVTTFQNLGLLDSNADLSSQTAKLFNELSEEQVATINKMWAQQGRPKDMDYLDLPFVP